MDQKTMVNMAYHAAVISALTMGYAMIGKKMLSMGTVDVGKADVNTVIKLTATVIAATWTAKWFTGQGIIPPNVGDNV